MPTLDNKAVYFDGELERLLGSGTRDDRLSRSSEAHEDGGRTSRVGAVPQGPGDRVGLPSSGLSHAGFEAGVGCHRNAEGRRVLLDYPERRVDVEDLRFAVRRAGLNEQAFLKALGDIVVPPHPK